MPVAASAFIHSTATVESGATVGAETKVWNEAQIRTGASVGARCVIGKGAFVDAGVVVGDDCKLQNYVCIYHGARIGRGVFIGPHVTFTNDLRPRATDANFVPLREGEWTVGTIEVDDGASIGANATVLPNVRIGRWAMVAAAAVVTSDVEPYALVIGNPARRTAWLCRCGSRIDEGANLCTRCGPLPPDHPLH